MASKDIHVKIEDQVLKLSNLDKLLFPMSGIIKAEMIQYYQQIAPFMLPHITSRPLTLIRFPDGIDKIKFYSKNKADWTPEWIHSIKMPDNDAIDYVMAQNAASLIWLANLAAIELHAMNIRANNFLPDVMIFDLDPPAGLPFEALKSIASNLKNHLESFGYFPFLKTSGSKGLHIYIPILNKYSTEEVVETAKELTKSFVALYPTTTTASVSKDRRTDKTFVDINRNHKSQTCVTPYSIRAKENAPISMPIHWDELENLKSSQDFTIKNAFSYLEKSGDAWSQIETHAMPLHNHQKTINTADSLIKYTQKRNFDKTNEPKPEITPKTTNELRYVIQIHDATNLHYDLRLEYNGILLSWAIPKSIPEHPGVKRMAIETEPHPMKYIDFEGIIPKEEYGGGQMWVFDSGTLIYHKKEAKKISFSLSRGKITGDFTLYNTDGNKWLIEKKTATNTIEKISIQPMLADMTSKIPTGYFYEIKWDGIRVIIKKENEKVSIISRNGNDITDKFPEISKQLLHFDAQTALLDGEIVVLDKAGIPQFGKVISRMHLTGKESIELASQHNKSTCYLFDMLYLDGQDTRNIEIERRREWIQICNQDTEAVRFSQTFEDGEALFAAIKSNQMEGIICKRKGSLYQSNSRNTDWLKFKVKNTEDATIIGYTKGKGDRSNQFGSLILAKMIDKLWVYKGKVGTGFDDQKMKEIFEILQTIPLGNKLIKDVIEEESQAVWLAPNINCEVQFASLTPNGTFREPVFVKLNLE